MDDSLYCRHLKLLPFDLLSPTSSSSSDQPTFSRKAMPVSRAESVGAITSRDHKPSKFLKFTLDDGTACISCILWLNHLSCPYFSRCDSGSVALLADAARRFAAEIQIGKVARVRGRIGSNREEV
ncbi:hypothetical protein SLEP1_g1063 [Rubroshorea leprosula]|uniref:CST complex subunit STN1 n=1 Tax=Rubroshorea leprosula TaxID=152421 RepID=A0AAV5HJM7_9ROSI|nr:hypothetical protein SLEP1_g1063 [Rubroshorea leprosula]